MYDVLVLAASAGGQAALLAVLRRLPRGFEVPIVLMQHLPPESGAVETYARRVAPFSVQWADAGSTLEPGTILICPPRSFVELLPDGSLRLSPSEGAVERPMDRLLESAARSFGHRAIAVVLTGMGSDGAAGALEVHRAGGRVLVQSEASAEYPEMPRAAIATGAAHLIVPLEDLGQVIGEVGSGTPRAKARSELEAMTRVFGERGEIAVVARDVEWSETPLGSVLNWPSNLRVMARMMVENTCPMCISWGPELVQLYNDAWIQFLGPAKHPRALGGRARENWPEIWHIIGPMFAKVMSAGEPVGVQNTLLYLNRGGVLEEVFATLDYAPIRDPASGAVLGVHHTAANTTPVVVAERRMRVLRDLASYTAGAATPREACERAAAALTRDTADLPFVLIYQFDDVRHQATLAGVTGLEAGTAAAPRLVTINAADGEGAWPLQAARTGAVLLDDLATRFPGLRAPPSSPSGTLPPRSAMLLPLAVAADKPATAVIVAGLSPHRPLDDGYRSFLGLVAQQIVAGKAEARARQIERERTERLAELDRTKTEFFANISHEFRTPLTLMLTPLEEMLERRNELPAGLAGEIDGLARNSRRLLRLVDNLLDFSEIETRRQRAPLALTNLSELTQDVASAFRSAIERAGLRFDVQCDPELPLVPVNPDMWEKVVSNLLSNALKFTFGGGISVVLKALSMHAELEVADSGVGIPQQELPNIFKRFHRVRGARARTVEGSGMGLAIVHDLVMRMGGQLTVRSVEGRGSRFRIWMPFKAVRQALDEPPVRAPGLSPARIAADLASEAAAWISPEDGQRGALDDPLGPPNRERLRSLAPGARVLVVDDNADMRDYLRRLLGAYWQVTAAADGAGALATARELKPDLVLADVMMPNMDGLELLHAIRADGALKHTPVIFLTARAGEDTAIEGLLAGADDYLAKPFSARELIARAGGQIELSRTRRHAQELNSFLVRFSDVVRGFTDPLAVARAACRMIHEQLGVDRAYWAEVDHATREFVILGGCHTEGVFVIDGRFPMDVWEPFASPDRETWSHVVDDTRADRRISAGMREGYAQIGVGADLASPVFADGTLRCVLSVNQRQPRRWTAEEIALVEGVAGRCWAEVERARAAMALRESESKYRTLFETMAQGYTEDELVRGPGGDAVDFRLLELNAASAGLLGVDRGRARGRLASEVAPDLDPWWVQTFERVVRTRTPERVERQVPQLGRWYEVDAYPTSGDRFVGLFHDITERKRAEETLRASEERFRLLFESIGEGFCIMEVVADERGKVTDLYFRLVNPAFEGHTGLSNVIGKSVRQFLPKLEQHWIDVYQRVWETGEPARGEYHAADVDRWYRVHHFRVGGAGSPLVGVVFDDITKRRRQEEALRASEEKYRTLFESIDEGFCTFDMIFDDAGEPVDYRFVEYNPAFERHTGLKDAIGRTLRELLPDGEPHWLELYGRVAMTGEPIRQTLHGAALNRWFEVYAFRMGEPQQRRVAAIFSDVTARKQTELALRASEERQSFLLKLSDAVRELVDPVAIMATVSEMVGRHFDVGRCGYGEVPPPHDQLVVARDWTNGVMPSLQGTWPLAAFGQKVIAQHRSGQTAVYEDVASDERVRGYEAGVEAVGGVRSSVAVQLLKGGAWVATFYVQDKVPRRWAEPEIKLLEAIAERTWAALARARAEAALRENETKYRTLFDSIDEGFAVFELLDGPRGEPIDLRYVETNSAFERHTGRRPEPGQTRRELFPEAKDIWLAACAEVARTGRAKRFVDYNEGLARWFDVLLFTTAAGGRRLAVIFRDVTEQKRAEAALRESDALNQVLLRLSDAIREPRDPERVKAVAADLLGEALRVQRATYADVAAHDCAVDERPDRDRAARAERSLMASWGPAIVARLCAGETLVVDDLSSDDRFGPTERRALEALHIGAALAVPLLVGGALTAICAVHDAEPRRWTPAEIRLVQEVAERTWAGVERARASLRQA